ncbi:hypothetical protein GCM10010174_20770 [Kutzneria viridogrisea]
MRARLHRLAGPFHDHVGVAGEIPDAGIDLGECDAQLRHGPILSHRTDNGAVSVAQGSPLSSVRGSAIPQSESSDGTIAVWPHVAFTQCFSRSY